MYAIACATGSGSGFPPFASRRFASTLCKLVPATYSITMYPSVSCSTKSYTSTMLWCFTSTRNRSSFSAFSARRHPHC